MTNVAPSSIGRHSSGANVWSTIKGTSALRATRAIASRSETRSNGLEMVSTRTSRVRDVTSVSSESGLAGSKLSWVTPNRTSSLDTSVVLLPYSPSEMIT